MEGFHSLSVWNHSQRPISREGAHPFNWGRTLLVQLGGVFFDKTLAEGPSAAPVRFCFMAHGSHRFIVCSVQGSLRGPHRKRCATKRGPPCKQGATHRGPHGSQRFIVWHTVRIDSSCAHVSTCGPHSKLCATIRGPPCKQGATSTTLHVFSFVAQQLSKIKLPSAFEKLTLCPPFRTHVSSFSWLNVLPR